MDAASTIFPMNEVKDWVQLGALVVGIVGGLIAVVQAIYEMRASTRQRYLDLRWRQANAAKELISDIHRDQRAAAAVVMMDWCDGTHEYDLGGGRRERLSYDDVLAALAKPDRECCQPSEHFVRDAFDWFFYYVDRIEHYIQTGLIEFVDVETVFEPYVRAFRKDFPIFDGFIAARDYELVPKFLARYGTGAVNAARHGEGRRQPPGKSREIP